MSTIKPVHTTLVYALAFIFLVLGVLGYLDLKNLTYLGYETNDYQITIVDENSPAQEAGMMVGDQIKTIDGLDVRDRKAWESRPRPTIGESREYVVDRNGEEVNYTLSYAPLAGKEMLSNRLAWTLGLIFIALALWVYSKNKTWAALMFALFGLGFGSSFLGGPYIEAVGMREFVNTVRFTFVLLSFAFLVAFLLNFPDKDKFLERKNANLILFGPAVLLSLVIIALTAFDPHSTSALNKTVEILFLLFIVFYFGWAILKMFKRYSSSDTERRLRTGIGFMFWGTILGLVPILILIVLNTLAPTLQLPGGDFVFLTMVLVPVAFALAINKYTASET